MSNRKNPRKSGPPSSRCAPADPMGPLGDDEMPTPSGARIRKWAEWTFGALLASGLTALLGFGIHHYALHSPRFALTEAEVTGILRLSREEVLSLAGASPGVNLFRLDLEGAEARVLSNPWVAEVKLERLLPSRLKIQVHERLAQALLVVGDKSFLVSSEGEAIKPLEAGDPSDFPRITGISQEALAKGGTGAASLEEAVALLSTYEKTSEGVRYPAEEVHFSHEGELILSVGTQGMALHLGRPPFRQKLLRASRVLEKVSAGGAVPSVVFLDNEAHPERVVVRLK